MARISTFDEDALYLICSSGYGCRDAPGNAPARYDSLDRSPKYLRQVRHGSIAQGDRTWCHERPDQALATQPDKA